MFLNLTKKVIELKKINKLSTTTTQGGCGIMLHYILLHLSW